MDVAPELPLLLGNVGAVQLNYGVRAADIVRALQAVGADAVNFHLNPLQEAIQPEGDTRFAGLYARLAEVIPELGVPALVKEVGAGIGVRAADKLARLPLAGVEVPGPGTEMHGQVIEDQQAEGADADPVEIDAPPARRLLGRKAPCLRLRHASPLPTADAAGHLDLIRRR